jgi:hypothetical protein
MISDAGTARDLIEIALRKGPEYVDLITAQTQEEFEKAFLPLLEKAIDHLESNKALFDTLDERGLCAVLKGCLEGFGLSVTQEAYSNGHVDLTIIATVSTPMRKKLAEAKIYDGSEYQVKGLNQLLGRYTTGRETNGLLIAYVRKENISGLMKKVREKFDEQKPLKQKGNTRDSALKWAFSSIHEHDCGDDLHVDHVGCNLYCSK